MNKRILAHCSSLDLLKRIPEKSVSLAYIDPPWNTEGAMSESDLASLYLHTAALCKACLKDDGLIVWHAVPRQISTVRSLLDRVYGEANFEAELILNQRRSPMNHNSPAPTHSNLTVYSKTKGEFFFNPPTREMNVDEKSRFNKVDEDGRNYGQVSLIIKADRPLMRFEWRGHTPPLGYSWRYSLERLENLAGNNRIFFPNNSIPMLKRYLDEIAVILGSVWEVSPPASSERVTSTQPIYQQPIVLAQRILSAFTKESDTIVDPYCGSGTFIVAAEKMNRQWQASDSDAECIKITSERVCRASTNEFKSLTTEDIENTPVHRRVSDLLKNFKVDKDPNAEDTHILVHRDESKTLEFKQTLILDKRSGEADKGKGVAVLKTIAAFLNSDGGALLIGVADDHSIPGIVHEIDVLFKGNRDKFVLHFQELLKSKIGTNFFPLIDHKIVMLDDVPVLRVDVRASNAPCFIGGVDFYVRTNPATHNISGEQLLNYCRTRFPDRA